jgi:hypothetical protein
MAFKLKPPFKEHSPIYERELEEGCMGKGNKNGTILIAPDLPKDAELSVIDHEEVHIDQVKRGDLDYNDEDVIWKGKKYPRSKMKEGNPNLPWEKEAYSKTDPYDKY